MIATLLLALAAQLDVAATLARWREDLALDQPKDVLAKGPELVAPGAELERNGEALALVAQALFAAREDGFDAAWKLLDGARATPDTAAAVELTKARLLIETDQLAAALQLLLADPEARQPRLAERPEAWLLAGRAWARSGQSERAGPFLTRFVELAPLDREAAAALHLLAQDALAHNDAATAQRWIARAQELSNWHALWKARVVQIRENPDEPLPRLGLAQLWLQAREPQRAREVLAELCARHPDYAPGWFLAGEAERALEHLDRALAAYSRTLELDPDHVLALNNRATIERLAGQLEAARDDFQRIVDGPHAGDRTALPAHLWLARVLLQLGDDQGAARCYARYVELGGSEPLKP